MKERMKKILSLLLVAGLMFGAIGGTVYAINNDKEVKEEVLEEQLAEVEEIKTDGASVYVFTDENGKAGNVIATDDILDESQVSEDKLVKELPISIDITYTLDGKEVNPESLEGKSGHLVIRYDYKNKQSQMMNVNGRQERIYVPYAVVTGIIFEDECFKNISAENGKVIDDGSHTVVTGIALPGLQSNLKVNKSDIDIPEFVEISADIENYEHPEALTIATNEMFKELDADSINSIDDLKGQMNKLTDAMSQLMDGSKKLYDGLVTLSEKSNELKDGVDKLYDGASVLNSGAKDLDAGVLQLQNGAGELAAGLSALTSNNEALQGGALTVYNTLLSVGTEQLQAAFPETPALTMGNYTQVLDGLIAKLDPEAVDATARAQVTAQVESNRATVVEQVTAAVRTQVEAKVTAGVTENVKSQITAAVESQRDAIKTQVLASLETPMTLEQYNAAVEAGMLTEEQIAAIEGATDSAVKGVIEQKLATLMKTEEVKATISTMTDTAMAGEEAQNNISVFTETKIQELISEGMQSDVVQSQLAAAAAGLQSVSNLKTSLLSYDAFYNGVVTYTNGVLTALDGANELKNGVDTLKAGSSKLTDGAGQLFDGVSQMKGNTPALIDGVNQLKDGSSKLADGITQLNDEGINKLVNAYNGDIEPLIARVKATVNAAKVHDTFAGVSAEKDSEIKFIYRTK